MRVKGAKRAREAGIAAARALAATRGAPGELEEPDAKRARKEPATTRAASGELEEPDAKRARKEPADEPGGASTPASTDSASTPAPAPAAGRAAGPASDAPIATGSVSTPAPAPTKPAVPTAEARDTDTFAAMRGIIEYVRYLYLFFANYLLRTYSFSPAKDLLYNGPMETIQRMGYWMVKHCIGHLGKEFCHC